jgi:hypothetical protein
MIKKNNKKAISGIVAAVIMIALVMAIGGIVWAVVSNLVTEQLEEAGSCFDIFDKVSINNKYTCWNYSSNETLFSINVADAEIDKIVVSITGEGTTKSFELSADEGSDELKYFPDGEYGNPLAYAPGKNEGRTYITDFFKSNPDSIVVYPVVGKKQCDVADTLTSIDPCILLG